MLVNTVKQNLKVVSVGDVIRNNIPSRYAVRLKREWCELLLQTAVDNPYGFTNKVSELILEMGVCHGWYHESAYAVVTAIHNIYGQTHFFLLSPEYGQLLLIVYDNEFYDIEVVC